MENNATLHRDADGSFSCATVVGEMGDVGGPKGTAEKCGNSEPSLGTLVDVSWSNSTANVSAPNDGNVISGAGKCDVPEVIEVLRVQEENQEDTTATVLSGDQLNNGMGQDSVLGAEDTEGGAPKLVNNQTDGPSSAPVEESAEVQAVLLTSAQSEPTKLDKPSQLCPNSSITENTKSGHDHTLSEGLASGSDLDPSLGGESRSLDSLESFSNLNSCPSSDLNSEGLEDRGLALALQSEYGADGTKTACVKDRGAGQSIYHIKWIKWREENTPIITQNENGPCPLLAIMNVLLLAWKVQKSEMGTEPWDHRSLALCALSKVILRSEMCENGNIE